MTPERSAVSTANDFPDEYDGCEGLAALANRLPLAEPSPELVDRVLRSVAGTSRFARFCGATASLLDLTPQAASRLLDSLDDEDRWTEGLLPDMQVYYVEGGPRTARAITGFIRLRAGAAFPDHEHIGEEAVLILQGRYEDDSRVFGPGDELVMPAGSAHSFTVRDGPDLLCLAVVHDGLRVGELLLTPRRPTRLSAPCR